MNYHKLLSKQILKFLPENLQEDSAIRNFLSVVSESYKTLEREKYLSERAFSISEEEYVELNKTLQQETEIKRLSIAKLKEAVSAISGIEQTGDNDDLLMIAQLLNQQINNRKNAEKVFTSLISNMQSGVLLEDENRQIVFCNQIFCDLFYMKDSPESLQGKNNSNNIAERKDLFKSPEKFVSTIDQLLKEKKLVTGEMLELEDGRVLERDYIPIFIENNYKGNLWSYTDVTEIIKSQKAIEQSELKSRLIMNASLDAIITVDKNGSITFWNPQSENIFGWSEQEVIGKRLIEIVIPSDYRETNSKQLFDFSNEVQVSFLNKQFDLFAIKKSGEKFPIELSVIPVKQGDAEFFCYFIKDISERKKNAAELERLSIIIQKSRNGIIVADATGKVEWVNDAYTKITGYTLEEIKGKEPGLAQGELTDANTILYMKEKVKKAEPFTSEIYNYKKSGEGYWVRVNAQPIFDNNNQVTQYFSYEEDITEEKNSQEKIKAAATRMSSLITNLHAGILLSNEDRTIALINQRFCDLFGITEEPSTLIGTNCYDFFVHSKDLFKDPESFIERNRKTLQERKKMIGEKLELKDERVFERDFVPIWNDTVYNGHLWVYTDITEKIIAEKRLDEQRTFYEEILDNIPADVTVFDSNHRYLYVNPMALKDSEMRKWIIGKTDEEYFQQKTQPLSFLLDVRRRMFNTMFSSLSDTKKLTSWEEEVINNEGNRQTILRNLYPVLDNDHALKIVIGYGIDITNIKNIQKEIEQSEKRYRDVIENSMAIVSTHDLEGKFITVNPMVGKTYGYSDDEMLGHQVSEFMLEEDKNLLTESYLPKIKRDKEASGIFRVLHKNGTIIYTLYNNFLKEELGKEPYVIGFSIDITDRVLAEKELKVAKQITEDMAKTKQNFLANMSHEIRTPMNAILGMTNQLVKSPLNKDQQFNLNIIQTSAENLLVIINNILDISKIEAGKLSLENIGFNLKSVIENSIHVMSHKAEEKGLILSNNLFDNTISEVLVGDPYRLNQILLNLISNSIKFTEKGSIDISCFVVNDSDQEQTIKLIVKDTGIGMDKSFASNLFNKFTQEDESISRRYGGTGLGLSICKELIGMMDGKVDVQSQKGSGTTFLITLPFNKGTEADMPKKQSEIFDTDILTNKKILIVDDNEMNRLVAAAILKNYGTEIEEAANGLDAIQKIENGSFDIVLMDVQMPVMDGFEATKIIRNSLSKDLPIIALTAFALKDDNLKCLEVGMSDYLSKPYNEAQLISMLSKWLEKNETSPTITKIEHKPVVHYDLSKLKEIAKGDQTFIKKMITLFCEQIPTSLQSINEAYQNKNFAELKAIAHRIKPSIDYLGIASLKSDVMKIEIMSLGNKQTDELTGLIQRTTQTLTEVIEAIQHNEF